MKTRDNYHTIHRSNVRIDEKLNMSYRSQQKIIKPILNNPGIYQSHSQQISVFYYSTVYRGYRGHSHFCRCVLAVPMLRICCGFAYVAIATSQFCFSFTNYVVLRVTVAIDSICIRGGNRILVRPITATRVVFVANDWQQKISLDFFVGVLPLCPRNVVWLGHIATI